MPYFRINAKITIFYLDEGPRDTGRPAVLLIPGLTCDVHDWSWQIPSLLELGLRIISIDPRGQGKSSNPRPTPGVMSWPGADAFKAHHGRIVDYYPQTTAHDVAALLRELGIRQVIIISHSLGDLAAYYLAAVARPGLVKAIVAFDPVHRWTNADRESNKAFFSQPEDIVAKFMGLIPAICPATMPPWQAAWFRRRAMEMDPEVLWAQCWGGWGDKQALGRMENAVDVYGGKLRCPRLVFVSTEAGAKVDRDVLPRGSDLDEVVLIDGAGHWFHQVRDSEVNSKLVEWLKKAGALKSVNGDMRNGA